MKKRVLTAYLEKGWDKWKIDEILEQVSVGCDKEDILGMGFIPVKVKLTIEEIKNEHIQKNFTT